jgi:nucleotide-binding universal stress UspA family protein
MSATLTLLNVQRLYMREGVSLFAGGELESEQEAKGSAKMLDDICLDVNKMFNVSCGHEIIPTVNSFEKKIADEAGDYNLTVIGTNGADDAYQFYFGSHSFRVARNSQSPVLIVPEGYAFKEITNVVFASDYNKGDELLLEQLKDFMGIFKPQLHVLHISRKDTEVGKELYRSFCNLTEEALHYDGQVDYKRIIAEDAAGAIETYMHKNNGDLLATCFQPHGIVYRMFHENLIKKLSSYADFPMLIFHK